MTVAECQEQIQQDLLCLLDGLDQAILDQVCQIVVDNMKKMTLEDDEAYNALSNRVLKLEAMAARGGYFLP